jgi:hypothetical protein
VTPNRTRIFLTVYNSNQKLRIEDRKGNSGREKITNKEEKVPNCPQISKQRNNSKNLNLIDNIH